MTQLPAPRITQTRLVATLALSAIAMVILVLVCALLGTDITRGGRIEFLQLSAIFDDTTQQSRFFWEWRLPHVLAATVVGAGLGGAGCAYQAVLRNPLADPFTLGVASGASLAAVVAIRFDVHQSALGYWSISACAMAGALATSLIVWRLGSVDRTLPPATLLLAGIAIAMFCSAATMFVQYTAGLTQVGTMVRWMMGGIDATRPRELAGSAALICVGVFVLLTRARDFNALSAGPDAAASVGVDATRAMTMGFVTASVIVGATIAIAGPIGFIGLMVPHAMRAVVGADHRILLPMSILVGATMLAVCDTIARIVHFPVGILTALLGGPFFLMILLRQKASGRLWGAG